MTLLPRAKNGANIGKKIVKKENSHCIMVLVGRNLNNIPVALVYIPNKPKIIVAIFPSKASKSLGMFLIIFLPRFFILSHTVLGSYIIYRTSSGR
jgi:hypothetical protein